MPISPNNVPPEIWRLIVSYIADDSLTLKSLRLVCHTFSAIASRFLFSIVRSSLRNPWHNLVQIARNPHLAEHVRTFALATADAHPELLKLDARDACDVSALHWTFEGGRIDTNNQERKHLVVTIIEYNKFSGIIMKRDSGKLLYWHNGRLRDLVRFWLGTGHIFDITVFPKLIQIGTQRAIFVQRSTSSYPHVMTRRLLEHVARAVFLPVSNLYHVHHWRTFAHGVGATLVHISLYKIEEILIHYCLDDKPLNCIKHLKIDISGSTWNSAQQLQSCIGRHTILANWISQASGLETVEVIQNPRLQPVIDIVREIRLPRSATIHKATFRNVTTFGMHLIRFAREHFGRLRELRILEPMIFGNDWDWVRAGLWARRWDFETLELNSAYLPEDLPEGLTRTEWNIRLHNIGIVPFPRSVLTCSAFFWPLQP